MITALKVFLTLIVLSASMNLSAQTTEEAVAELIVEGIGSLFRAGQRSGIRRQWERVPEIERSCFLAVMSNTISGVTVDSFISQNIPPTHETAKPLLDVCHTLANYQLQTDIACEVQNSQGETVVTRCREIFAIKSDESLGSTFQEVDFEMWVATVASSGVDSVYDGVSSVELEIALEKRLEQERIATEVAAEKERIATELAAENARLAREAERLQREREEEERRQFLASPEGQRQIAEQQERQRQQQERERLQREARERAAREENERIAREFPFYAVLTCGIQGHITMTACWSGEYTQSELNLSNGSEQNVWTLVRYLNGGIPNARETGDGLRIELRNNFRISMQNVGGNYMMLGIKVYERSSGSVVYQQEVGRFGAISIRR